MGLHGATVRNQSESDGVPVTAPNGAAQQVTVLPLMVMIPINVRGVEIVQVVARWQSLGGIQLGNRTIPHQVGLPIDLIVRLFVKALNEGLIQEQLVVD